MTHDQNFELSPLQVHSLKSQPPKKRGRPVKHRDTDLCPCQACTAMSYPSSKSAPSATSKPAAASDAPTPPAPRNSSTKPVPTRRNARPSGKLTGTKCYQPQGGKMLNKTWITRARTIPPNCPRCEAMNGQTVPMDDQFTTPEGEKISGPPLHPHCDCILEYTNP